MQGGLDASYLSSVCKLGPAELFWPNRLICARHDLYSLRPSDNVPYIHSEKCLLKEFMHLYSSLISSSTSKERKRMHAFLRKAVDLKSKVEFGNKIKILINLDLTNPTLYCL